MDIKSLRQEPQISSIFYWEHDTRTIWNLKYFTYRILLLNVIDYIWTVGGYVSYDLYPGFNVDISVCGYTSYYANILIVACYIFLSGPLRLSPTLVLYLLENLAGTP